MALAARGEEDLARAAKEVEAAGGEALPVATDVTDQAQVQALVDRTVKRFGTVDILVNNAGAAPFFSTLDQIRMEGFEKYFRVNFNSAVLCTKAVAPVLLAKREGCVLNVASVAAFVASPGLTYYASAKAALINFTRTVAQEWAASGIRVNALAPGWVETELNEPARRQIPDFNQRVLASIPLGRWGKPEDAAGAALFLCSPAASASRFPAWSHAARTRHESIGTSPRRLRGSGSKPASMATIPSTSVGVNELSPVRPN